MDNIDKELLKEISNIDSMEALEGEAYNIRKNGQGIDRRVTENVNIISKEDGKGIDIYVKENTKYAIVHIPVILTEGGFKDLVYNDFYIGKNAKVAIIAGCGIHNDHHKDSQHDGIHRFFIEEGAKVKYIEKHYGQGNGTGKKILNPVTEVTMKENSTMEMETYQIKGVSSTIRNTNAKLEDGATLVITEKILTDGDQTAETNFTVELNGENSSANVTSRSVATQNSKQIFKSNIYGNSKCFSHVECDAIIKDKGKVTSIPEITANCVDANLIHEAAIGKIAGEQLIKLMSLGLTEKEAEDAIINGFLK